MAGGWLSRYSNPDKSLKRTPIEKFRVIAFPLLFLGSAAIVTGWFWQQFVFNEPIKEKDHKVFASNRSQETLDNLRKINSESKK